MRTLSAWDLLHVWERGWAQPAVQRALLLLAAACPDTPPDALAELSIGQRDGRLLALREWTFGPQLAGMAICPGCGERLEFTFGVADIRVAVPSEPGVEERKEERETLSLPIAGYEVRFRLPNSLDLAAIANCHDPATARRQLLKRCLLSARRNGEEAGLDRLPGEAVDGIVERMAQADPQADVQLDMSCPACDHRWQAAFDIVSFFWGEINAWAQHVLREVHLLASAYGWREADILAMSAWRRQLYLEMIGG